MSHATKEQRAQRRVGTVLRDKYALERVLGVGGMAAVYLGVHRNGHRVAVKVLHPEASDDPDVKARFLREGYVANSIGHPGAVRVLDDDVAEDGSAFLVMELLEGETLYARAPSARAAAFRCARCWRSRASSATCSRPRTRRGRPPGHQAGEPLPDDRARPQGARLRHRPRQHRQRAVAASPTRPRAAPDPGRRRPARARAAPGPASRWARPRSCRRSRPSATAATSTPAPTSGARARPCSRSSPASSCTRRSPRQELLVRAATTPARSLADVAPDVPAPVVALVDRALRFSRDERWPTARAMREAIEEAHLAAFGEPVSPSSIGPVRRAPSTSRPLSPRWAAPTAPATIGDTQPAAGAPGAKPPAGARPSRTRSCPSPPSARPSAAGPPPPTSTRARARPPSPPPPPPAPVGLSSSPPRPPVPSRAPRSGPVPPVTAGGTRAPGARGARRQGRRRSCWRWSPACALVVARTRHPATAPDCRAPGWACGAAAGAPAWALRYPGCTESRACVEANQGRPAICRRADGACVPLASEGCHVLAEPGDVGNDATVWVGAMFPLHGPTRAPTGKRSCGWSTSPAATSPRSPAACRPRGPAGRGARSRWSRATTRPTRRGSPRTSSTTWASPRSSASRAARR